MTTGSFWAYAASLLMGAAGAWAVARWGHRLALLDRPGHRSSHSQTTPKGGGIGLLAAFVLCSLGFDVPTGFWIPAVVVSGASFLNDRREMGVKWRLGIQFLAAGLFLAAYAIPGFDSLSFGATIGLAIFYAVFVVGTTNYYNFMDGINGIAAITGMVGFGLLAAYGHMTGKPDVLWCVSLGMVFACAGFLPFNIPGAQVFMGDVGSVLLGFVFAGLVVVFSASPVEFLVCVAFLFPFYADELFTMVERVKAGEQITHAHRRHLYQVLANELGVAHWKVSAGYGMVQLAVGLCIWMLAGAGLLYAAAAVGVFSVIWGGVDRRIKNQANLISRERS